MRVSLACAALFAAAFIGAYTATSIEVEDLGAVDLSDAADHKMPPVDADFDDDDDYDDDDYDDDDDYQLGEGAGVGRGSGGLRTRGSFTLSGGRSGGKEEDLGEGAGVGRGSGGLRTR